MGSEAGALLGHMLKSGSTRRKGWAAFIGVATTLAGATAAALVVLMLWIYFSAQVFLLGAEFAAVSLGAHEALDASSGESAPQVPNRAVTK